ncbi:MAG: SDR family NAD(P)-dependent oxidoreductase [Salinarimonas sp.]|nr:SDR family NAD(P)-dependent oxidoreductase [Salinarimonas sp.]
MAQNLDALSSFPDDGIAVVAGATGGIGSAFVRALEASGRFTRVVAAARGNDARLDLLDPTAIAGFARSLEGERIRLVIDATGFLHDDTRMPEKSWRDLDADHMAYSYAVNAIGPALLMQHLLPLLPREGKAAFVTLSAKVGSISDNRIGGWYSYRASKAALNQIVRCAAIELDRRWREALCVAMHPGTVHSPLTQPFAKSGLNVREPDVAAGEMLAVIDGLTAEESGGFFDYRGERLPW